MPGTESMTPPNANPRTDNPHRQSAHTTRTIASLNSGDGQCPVSINAFSLPIDLNTFGAEGDPAKPVTLEIIPAPGANGLLPARNGRRQRITDMGKLAAALNAQSTHARVDFDHRSEPQSPLFAGTTEAEGWLSDYRLNHRGGIDAAADLGTLALDRVRAKRYRYISPALLLTANDDVVGLSSIALVNNPNLPLDAPRLNSERDVKTQAELDAEAALSAREQKLVDRETRAAERALNAAARAVDAAIAAGTILPAQKDYHLGSIKGHAGGVESGIDAFNAFVETAGVDQKIGVLTRRIGPTGAPPRGAERTTAPAYYAPEGWQPPSDERLELHAKIAAHAQKRGIPYREALIEFGALGGG